jgi:hypothetical protein
MLVAHAASRSKPLDFAAELCGCITDEGSIISTKVRPAGTIVKEEPGQSAQGALAGGFGPGAFEWHVTKLTVNQTTAAGKEKGTAQVMAADFNVGTFTNCRFRGKVTSDPTDTNVASEGKLKCKEGTADVNRFKAEYAAAELACTTPQICPPSSDPFRVGLLGTVFFNPQ